VESNENFTSYRNEFHFWLRLKELNHKGIIVYNWNNKWDKRIIGFFESIGFKSPNVLIKFIDNNSINSIDLNQMRTANSIRHDINNIRSLISMKQASIVDYSDQLKYAYLTLLFLLFILYPIRYLLKLIIWCLKVLIN
jgi:hypothetical protein